METTTQLPAYDDTARLLHEAGVSTGASEAHGIITGVLCAPQGARVTWVELVLGRGSVRDRGTTEALTRRLTALHGATYAQLNGLEYEFTPLLPGDEHSLAEQIDGLTEWCRGYLLGLQAGGWPAKSALGGDVGEIIRDITLLSEAEPDAMLSDEEEARILVEIVEYLRVGVQLVFEELQPSVAKH